MKMQQKEQKRYRQSTDSKNGLCCLAYDINRNSDIVCTLLNSESFQHDEDFFPPQLQVSDDGLPVFQVIEKLATSTTVK